MSVEDAFAQWVALRERSPDVGYLKLYDIVAAQRGVPREELPLDERLRLGELALGVLFPGHVRVQDRGTPPPIVINAPDPSWPAQFATWRERISAALSGDARVEHVGSTAVPGLPAKPILDVQIAVADVEDESSYVPSLEALGIALRSRRDVHRFMALDEDEGRRLNIHVCSRGSTWERNHLLFRDYLRVHDDERDLYAATKQRLATVWRDDRIAYTEAKGDVIHPMLERAEAWAQRVGWRV